MQLKTFQNELNLKIKIFLLPSQDFYLILALQFSRKKFKISKLYPSTQKYLSADFKLMMINKIEL